MKRRSFSTASSPEDKARASTRLKALCEANELMGRAWRTGGNSAVQYTNEQLGEAIILYGQAKLLFEALGNRTFEVRTCMLAIDACRLTIAANNASSAIGSATGTR